MSTASAKSASPRKDTAEIQRRLLAALDVEIEPVRPTWGYLFSATFVAGAMLLLPLLYLVLIALVAHTIYWFCVHNADLLRTPNVKAIIVLYFGPIISGAFVLIFLVKPLFARRAKQSRPQRLSRDAEPFLYEYVAAVAEAVGAPPPRSIRVGCDVNAAASFRRGLASFFSDDLTLYIGLPLAQGLTVREFTSTLAHEFGHFAQRGGMRLYYIINVVNDWLMRVTFSRDEWDEWFATFLNQLGGFGWIIMWIVRFGVWLTRTVLWGLTWAGTAISRALSRQQEFDADRHQVRLVGLPTYVRETRRLRNLHVAQMMAEGDLQRFWDEGRLADDYSALVVSNLQHLTPDIKKQLRKREREEQAGLFDTHPTDRERIASARREETDGVLHLPDELGDLPATTLFQDFRKLSRAASADFYRSVLGDEFSAKKLHPSARLIESREQEIAARKALERYFQTAIPLLRPLPIADDAAQRPASPQETAKLVQQSRDKMLAAVKDYETLCERYDEAESSVFRTTAAQALIDCKLPVKAADFRLLDAKPKTIADKLKRGREGLHQLAAKMLAYETEAGARLSYALQLLQLDAVAKRIPGGADLRAEVDDLLPEAQFISRQMSELLPLRILHHRLGVLFSATKPNEDRQPLIKAILSTMELLHGQLTALQDELGERRYPFDHADATMTLRNHVLPEVPEANNPYGLNVVTQDAALKLMTLQFRLFARLAQAAEKVEAALGMPPLPEPKPKEAEDREE